MIVSVRTCGRPNGGVREAENSRDELRLMYSTEQLIGLEKGVEVASANYSLWRIRGIGEDKQVDTGAGEYVCKLQRVLNLEMEAPP